MFCEFFSEFFVLQNLSNRRMREIGKEIEGLYYFPNHLPEKVMHVEHDMVYSMDLAATL